jgi:hypothetical protein
MTTKKPEDAPISGVTATMLAAELARLSDLAKWDPISQRADAVLAALHGVEGITPRFVAELRIAAQRWTSLDPRLRAFYAEVAPIDDVASRVLYQLLFTTIKRAETWHGPKVGHLHRLWAEMYGVIPVLTLYPNME